MVTMEINKGAAMDVLHVDWAADRRWGDRATYFIKVSPEQRVQGKGRLYMAGV